MSRTILNTSWMLTLLSFLVLAGCGGSGGGDAETGLTKIPDLTLSSLEVRTGEISLLDFKQGETGPYELSVDSTVSSIEITATASSSDAKILISTVSTELLNNGQLDTKIVDEREVQSGQQDLRNVLDGDNTFLVTLVDTSNTYRLEYRIRVHRVSSDASMQFVLIDKNGFFDRGFKAESLTKALDFKSITKEYKLETEYSFCSVTVKPVISEPSSKLWINGRPAYHREASLINLSKVGSTEDNYNVIEMKVESEDKTQTETYTIKVERKNPTETELSSVATIESLTLTEGSFTSPFSCTRRQLVAVVNRSITTTGLTVTPSSSTATMRISKYAVGQDGSIKLDETGDPVFEFEGLTLPSNEIYDLQLEPGNNRYLVESYAANHSSSFENTVSYALLIVKTDTNWIPVNNSSQLQQALINASAGDEIYLYDGDYVGATDTSGDAFAYFYSSASGTADNPITLRAESGRNIKLSGTGVSNTSVLKLTGDYWMISNLSLENAGTGLLLDSASYHDIDRLTVVDQTGPAVLIQNGSNNNLIQNSEFSSSSKGIVVGSDDSQWSTAPTPGEFLPENNSNQIRFNSFGRNILNEHIIVHEGVSDTVIESNVFDSAIKTGVANGETVIRNLANNTQIRNNTFYNSTSDVESQQITNQEPDEIWNTEAWATNLQVFGNRIDLGGKVSDFVNNQSSQEVLTGKNARLDNVDLVNSGAMFSDVLTEQKYQLQVVADPVLCLDFDDIKNDDGTIAYKALNYMTCGDISTQVWLFEHDVDGRVFLVNDTERDLMMAPKYANFLGGPQPIISFSRAIESKGNYYYTHARWLVDYESDMVILRNNLSSSYVVTPASNSIESGIYATLSINTNSDTQKFKLIAVP